MKLSPLSESIVLQKQGLSHTLIQTSEIEDQILKVFEDSRPIVNKFPDFLAITLPSEQFQILFRNDTVSITADIVDGASHRKELVKISRLINKDLSEFPLIAYGLNFRILIDALSPEKLHSYVSFQDLEKSEVFGTGSKAMPLISIMEKLPDNENLRQLTIAPSVNPKTVTYTGAAEVSTNLHTTNDQLPEQGDLIKSLADEYALVETALRRLLDDATKPTDIQ